MSFHRQAIRRRRCVSSNHRFAPTISRSYSAIGKYRSNTIFSNGVPGGVRHSSRHWLSAILYELSSCHTTSCFHVWKMVCSPSQRATANRPPSNSLIFTSPPGCASAPTVTHSRVRNSDCPASGWGYRTQRSNAAYPAHRCARPQDFPAEFWRTWCIEFEKKQPCYPVIVRVAPDFVPLLPQYFGDQACAMIGQTQPDAEGWLTVTLSFETFGDALNRILGLGRAVEVLAGSTAAHHHRLRRANHCAVFTLTD